MRCSDEGQMQGLCCLSLGLVVLEPAIHLVVDAIGKMLSHSLRHLCSSHALRSPAEIVSTRALLQPCCFSAECRRIMCAIKWPPTLLYEKLPCIGSRRTVAGKLLGRKKGKSHLTAVPPLQQMVDAPACKHFNETMSMLQGKAERIYSSHTLCQAQKARITSIAAVQERKQTPPGLKINTGDGLSQQLAILPGEASCKSGVLAARELIS